MDSPFAVLLRRAALQRRLETDPLRGKSWAGYVRGLRRAHHGEQFGTETEHELWVSASESTDSLRAALGRGYCAGLLLTAQEPG